MGDITPGISERLQDLPDLFEFPFTCQVLTVSVERKELIGRFMVEIQTGDKRREYVLDLLPILSPGGLEEQIIELYDQLKRRGIDDRLPLVDVLWISHNY